MRARRKFTEHAHGGFFARDDHATEHAAGGAGRTPLASGPGIGNE